jgi:hypothetical protein
MTYKEDLIRVQRYQIDALQKRVEFLESQLEITQAQIKDYEQSK